MSVPHGFVVPPRPTFEDLITVELDAVDAGKRDACGHTCECHGGHTCIRAIHPDHDHHQPADCPGELCTRARSVRGPGWHDEERAPHVARLDDGSLVQWTGPCPPPAHEGAI